MLHIVKLPDTLFRNMKAFKQYFKRFYLNVPYDDVDTQ